MKQNDVMDGKFVYVFSEDDRDTLLKSGFHLIKSDKANHVYVFENQIASQYALRSISYVPSNILTF